MISPRCRQMALSARIVPSSPRTTSTGLTGDFPSPANRPGSATCSHPADADPAAAEHFGLLEGEKTRPV